MREWHNVDDSAPEHDAPQRVRGVSARSPHEQDKYDKIPQHARRRSHETVADSNR